MLRKDWLLENRNESATCQYRDKILIYADTLKKVILQLWKLS